MKPVVIHPDAEFELIEASGDFPYALVYVDKAERILLVAVAHQSRRPGYWAYRLKTPI